MKEKEEKEKKVTKEVEKEKVKKVKEKEKVTKEPAAAVGRSGIQQSFALSKGMRTMAIVTIAEFGDT